MYNSTREASSRQERAISKTLGARRTANSGATAFSKRRFIYRQNTNRSKNSYAT